MFIVWGKKIVYRTVGHVADFCPICRGQRAFEIRRIGSAGHVYYISLGEGELVGFERTCSDCGTALNADPQAYASVSKQAQPLPALAASTFPNYAEVLRERTELERRVQESPGLLSPEERRSLIAQPFVLLSPKVERRFSSTHIDRNVGLAILGAFLLFMFGSAAARAVAPDSADGAVLLLLALGIGVVIWQGLGASRRFMRREVIPQLARALRPLRPRETEMQAVLAELKQMRHKLGSKLVLADLQEQLARNGAPLSTGPAGATAGS